MPVEPSCAVTVSLLGGLRVVCGTAALDSWDLGRRAQLALARLALEAGTAVPRAVLAEATWGAALPVTWRESLRNVAAELRRALVRAGLGGAVELASADGGYLLRLPPGSTVDVVVLREQAEAAARSLSAGQDTHALQIAEAALGAAPALVLPAGGEEWVEGVREQVARLRIELELVACEAALRTGDARRAERIARHLVAATPLREEAHRLLMRALLAAGNHAQALAAYDACRRLLDGELGTVPSLATQQLFVEMLDSERVEGPAAATRPGRIPTAGRLLAMARAGPFVGRQPLLDQLAEQAGLLGRAGAFVVCLNGEPGMGKTRLAAELATRCAADGIGVLYGRAEQRLRLPYAALLEAVERGLVGVDHDKVAARLAIHRAALGTLLPSIANEAAGPVRPTPYAVRAALLAVLAVLAGERGALLVIDDAQWATHAELAVVRDLLADPQAARLLVLVLHHDPTDPAALAGLGEHPRVRRVALEPLDVSEVSRLLAHGRSGGRDTAADVRAREVWRASGGNPLLAMGLWGAPDAAGEGLSGSPVAELVRRRLEVLPAGSAEVLRLAALSGLEFDVDPVCTASAAGAVAARKILAAARAIHLLTEADEAGRGERLAFRHGLLRDALLDGLDPHTRAQLHVRLGGGLETAPAVGPDPAGGPSPDMIGLAYHFAAAAPVADWQRVLRYGLPVARQAYEAGVYEDAIALASRALESLARVGDPQPQARLQAMVLLGGAQRALGDPHGHDTLRRAFEEARTRGDGAVMADALMAVAPVGAVTEGLFLDDGQLADYEQTLAVLGEDAPGHRARLLARLACAYAWRHSQRAALPFAAQALELARADGDPALLATVLASVRLALTSSSDLAQLAGWEDELAALAEHSADPVLAASVALWRYGTAVQQGDGSRLEALLAEASERSRGLRIGNLEHAIAYEHASLALLRGRVAEAELLVDRAARTGADAGLDASVIESIRLAQLMRVRGEQRRLGELRERAMPLFGPAAPVPVWRAAMAQIEAAAGLMDGVAERIDAVLDAYQRTGPSVLCSGGAIATLVPTALLLGDLDRVLRIRGLITPLSGQGVYVAVFAGPVDYYLALLDRFLGHGEDAEAGFVAAARFCERLGAPRWQARCTTAGA